MIAFIEDQRVVYGVESICRVLPIAPSTYYHRVACLADPSKASERHRRDAVLRPEIKRVWDENYQVYGVRKAWHQLKREGFELARCTVERLMKQIGIRGAVRGKVVKTTVPDTSAPCPRDKVNRVFRAPAPNLLWVSDFTYVSTWQGFVYVAFVVDTFADRIVGWRVSRSAKTDFVLDALEQALHNRRPVQKGGLVHHSDRGGTILNFVLWRGNCSERRRTYEHRQRPVGPADGRPFARRPVWQGRHSFRTDEGAGGTRADDRDGGTSGRRARKRCP